MTNCVVEQRDSYVFWRRGCASIGRIMSEICQNKLWTKGIGQTGAEICHSKDGHIWCLIASRAQSLGGHAGVCRGCRAQEAISGSHCTLCYNGELNGAAVRACRQILIGQCAWCKMPCLAAELSGQPKTSRTSRAQRSTSIRCSGRDWVALGGPETSRGVPRNLVARPTAQINGCRAGRPGHKKSFFLHWGPEPN